MFCRVCHFYNLTDEHVLNMPIRRFWMMNHCIGRIQAEKDLRALNLTGAQSEEGFREVQQSLNAEMGEISKVAPMDAERDEAGFEALRQLGRKLK